MATTSDGTVRGSFSLNVGPAVRGVREYKREAAAADVMTQQLGGTMDRTFGREKAAQINTVTDATGSLGSQTARTRTLVRSEWQGMRRDVARESNVMIASIKGVKRHVRELGEMRASPKIDLDGIAEALAQVALLDKRLSALGRQRVTPRVAMGGATGGGRSGGGLVTGGGDGGGGLPSVGRMPGGSVGLGLVAAGLPAVQALTGAAVGLGGSLMGAGLGAGAVGLSSGGALAAGIGSVVAVAKPAQTILKDALTAQKKYTDAVKDFGVKSKQAARAKLEMDQAFGDERGLRRATRQIAGFKGDWKRLTAPGRASYYGLLGDVAQRGREVAPNLAAMGNRSTAAVRGSGSRFARFATNRENLGTMDRATGQFARELPTVERTLENVALTMGRLYRASAPFFHDANVWVEKWTGGLAASTGNVDATREKMRGLVDEAKLWAHLSGTTFRLLRDIFSMGAPSGDSLVVSLTRTMDRWDAWVNSNPEQVRGFFSDAADSVRGMAKALSGVVQFLNQMATLLRPLLDRFSQLVGLASQLGVIGAPGALLALRGGLAGGRGALGGGRGGRGGRGGGGVAPVVLGGGAAVGGASAMTRSRALYGTSRALGAGRTAAGAAAGGGLVRGVVGGALRGAGRAFLPITAGLGVLDFITAEGGFVNKLGTAESSMTMGFIPRPSTRAERKDNGLGAAQKLMGGVRGGRSGIADLEGLVSQAQREASTKGAMGPLERAAGTKRMGGIKGLFGGVDNPLGADGVKKGLGVLQEELRARRALVAQMDKEREHRKDERSVMGAQRYAGGLSAGFKTYQRAGASREDAFGSTLDQVQEKLKKTRDAGVETLGEGSLAWARAMAKGNPAMKKTVRELTEHIRERFEQMGKRVSVVNGNILTGSRKEWRGIRDALTGSSAEAARQVGKDFTAIQQQAVGSLRSMGFTPAQAKSLVADMEKGGKAGASAGRVASGKTKTGDMGFGVSDAAGRARGGTVPGRGLSDTVRMGGAMVAPGETWIANRHTMKDLSRATVGTYGLTAEQMIRGETRRHAQRFATGGLAKGMGRLVSRLSGAGFSPSSTTGGTHAAGSYHYSGQAADYGDATSDLPKLWSILYPMRRRFAELFGPSSLRPKPTLMHNGQGFSDGSLQAGHEDHIHVALTGGGGALGKMAAGAGAGGGGRRGRVRLRGVGMRQPGLPGVMRSRAGDMFAGGLRRKLNRKLGRMGGGGGGGDLSGFKGGGGASANMRLGHRMMLAAGFGEDQWPALRQLWMGESGWRSDASNASSGAFGIPQCVGVETKILTRRGWLAHDEVEVGDETIGYDPQTGASRWTKVTAVHHPGRHRVRRFGTSRWSAICTPNHRWLVELLEGESAARAEALVEQQELVRGMRVVLSRFAETDGEAPITTNEAALLGWIASEGWAAPRENHPRNPRTYFVCQTKTENFDAIDEACSDGKASRYPPKSSGSVYWRLSAPYSRDLDRRAGHPREDAEALVLVMSPEQRVAWLDAVIRGEGSVYEEDRGRAVGDLPGRYVWVSQRPGPFARAIVLAAYLCGFSPRVAEDKRDGCLRIGLPEVVTVGCGRASSHIDEDAGEREVWCVTTELGTWTAEQYGNVFLTGNSLPASKMGAKAAAGDPAAQIRWGLCVPLRTRILTRRGWLSYDEVVVGDETIGFNPDTGRSEWTTVEAVHVMPGDVVRFGTSVFSAECTTNHRWVMERVERGDRRTHVADHVSALADRTWLDRIVLARPADTDSSVDLTVQEAALVGWIAGDGHIGLSAPYARDLLARAGHPREDAVALVLAMSSEQREAWIGAIIAAEGTLKSDDGSWEGAQIFQAPGPLAHAIVLAVYLAGYRPGVYRRDRSGKGGRETHQPELTITMCRGRTGRPDSPGYKEEVVGRQETWCVTTGLGSWTAEQDGQVFLTGNSYVRDRYKSPSGALSAWNSRSPHWYARGGKMDWGGGFKNGGSMVTNGPTAFVAGEGHRRRERVTVTPANRPAGGGSGEGVTVKIEAGAVVVKIEGGIKGGGKGGGDVDALAERVGKKVVGKVIEALDRGLGTVGG